MMILLAGSAAGFAGCFVRQRDRLAPLGGTKLNWASCAAGFMFQPLKNVAMLSFEGVSVSVTTYLQGHGSLPAAIQI